MWQLLLAITQTINTLFPVVTFLKCVVTEVVLFSIVAFKTLDISQGSVGVVGSLVIVLLQISPDSDSKIILKIG